jgi:hypothetical protein
MNARSFFEDDATRLAQFMIATGSGFSDPTYSDDEQAEVDALTPAAITAIRDAVESVEAQLRAERPIAAELHDLGVEVALDARYAALSATDSTALNILRHLADMRADLVQMDQMAHATATGWIRVLDWWPPGFTPPTSPEITQIRALTDAAVAWSKQFHIERGQRLLQDVQSGRAWARLAAGR